MNLTGCISTTSTHVPHVAAKPRSERERAQFSPVSMGGRKMGKLKLDMETLEVQSFEAGRSHEAGTVWANDDDSETGVLGVQFSCNPDACGGADQNTCSCQGTCKTECPTGCANTCVQWPSCMGFPSCRGIETCYSCNTACPDVC